MIQVSDEQAFGFAPASSVKLSPLPKAENENVPDESEYTISASGAKKTAEKALKSYSGFKASAYTCIQDKMLSCDGIKGPLYRFAYLNKKGQMIYVAYVHCITGELLYKGDYSGFQYDKDIADLRTASPTTAPRTGYVIIKGDVVWDPFAGLATTALCCRKLGRSCYSAEISEKTFKNACLRLSELEIMAI